MADYARRGYHYVIGHGGEFQEAAARAAAELPLAQQSGADELLVVGAAPVSRAEEFSSSQQFARRLEPLAVTDPDGDFEAAVLESTLLSGGASIMVASDDGVTVRARRYTNGAWLDPVTISTFDSGATKSLEIRVPG